MQKKKASDKVAGDLDPEQSNTTNAFRIVVLVAEDGNCPFDRWLNGLRDRAARARLLMRLLRLEQHGNYGDHRERILGALSELRIDYGPGYRLYYVRHGDMLVILLGGGIKDRQQDDIAAAAALWERNKDDAERFSREFRSGSA